MGGRAGDGDPLGMKLEGLASWNPEVCCRCFDASLRRGVLCSTFNITCFIYSSSLSPHTLLPFVLLYMFVELIDVIEKHISSPFV